MKPHKDIFAPEKTPFIGDVKQRSKTPEFRRPVSGKRAAFYALAALTIAGYFGDLAYNGLKDLNEVDASIPTEEEFNAHPENFVTRQAKPGENLGIIAQDYSGVNADGVYYSLQDNIARLEEQNDGKSAVSLNDVFLVPVTTIPKNDGTDQ